MANPEEVQAKSKKWWSRNPMSYDWRGTLAAAPGSPEFFDEVDARFLRASPFYAGSPAFSRLIPYGELSGKKALEIGCGFGTHADLLTREGVELTAIDLTATAVEMTKQRLLGRGASVDVLEMDAEKLEFADESFDFIWSWGVIHHSARPEQILREAYRVLRSGAQLRLMVYHRKSIVAWVTFLRGLLSGKFLRGMNYAEVLSHYTDGYIARYYTRREMSQLLTECGFVKPSIRVLGQTTELVPIPGSGVLGGLKERITRLIPDPVAEAFLARFGSFLFAVAHK